MPDLAVRDPADIIEAVVLQGDLNKLQPAERVTYYRQVCRSLGLNELTRPFQYIVLNGALTLYATKNCTDQLRELHGVSITRLEFKTLGDIYLVTAYAVDKSSRTDSSTGAVAIGGLRGEMLANAYMKAETKSKRRVTLSLCGLGWTDESEIETIPGAQPVQVDADTGEFVPLRDQDPAAPRDRIGKLLEGYGRLLTEARHAGAVADAADWILPSGTTEADIIRRGRDLRRLLDQARSSGDNQSLRSAPGEVASPSAPRRADMWAVRRVLEVKALELGIRVPTLNSRCSDEDLAEANDALRLSIKAVEDDLAPEFIPQQAQV